MTDQPIHLRDAFSRLTEFWSPKVIGSVNGQYVKVAKVLGEFPWHAHADEDELFLVLRGCLRIHRHASDGGTVALCEGEMCVVPRGVQHATSATEETHILLVEPVSTEHAGKTETPLARSVEEQLR